MAKLKETETRLQLRLQEAQRRENVLNMRLATKQQETQEIMVSGGREGNSGEWSGEWREIVVSGGRWW